MVVFRQELPCCREGSCNLCPRDPTGHRASWLLFCLSLLHFFSSLSKSQGVSFPRLVHLPCWRQRNLVWRKNCQGAASQVRLSYMVIWAWWVHKAYTSPLRWAGPLTFSLSSAKILALILITFLCTVWGKMPVHYFLQHKACHPKDYTHLNHLSVD